jgi:hypothetical protein
MPWYAWLVVGWICGGALFLSGWISGASVVRAAGRQDVDRRRGAGALPVVSGTRDDGAPGLEDAA